MVFEMVRKKVISEEQARLSAQSNVILKALGINSEIDVEIEDLFDNSAMRNVLRIVERSNRCWNRKYCFKKHI